MMLEKILPLALVLPLGLAACGGVADDEDELVTESASLAITTEDEDADESAEPAAGVMDGDMDQATEEVVASSTEDTPGDGAVSCNFGEMRRHVIERFDEDGDGRLNQAERAALREELAGDVGRRGLARRLLGGRHLRHHVFFRVKWAFDADNDGTLSEAERADMVAALEQRCERRRARILENFDANGDGQLQPEELRAAVEAKRQAWQERKAAFLAQYDTNGDGHLDLNERAAVREALLQKRQEKRAEILARFDADGNGRLEGAEIDALKAEIRRRVAEGPQSQP